MATIALGADHAGFELKRALGDWLAGHGHVVLDCGTDSGGRHAQRLAKVAALEGARREPTTHATTG